MIKFPNRLAQVMGLSIAALLTTQAAIAATLPTRPTRPTRPVQPTPTPTSPIPASPSYQATKIALPAGYGSLAINAINNNGTLVGTMSDAGTGTNDAFKWSKSSGLQLLNRFTSDSTVAVYQPLLLNQADQIVGKLSYDGEPAYWGANGGLSTAIPVPGNNSGYPGQVITEIQGLTDTGLVYGTTFTYVPPVYDEYNQFPGLTTQSSWVWNINTASWVTSAPAFIAPNITAPTINASNDTIGNDAAGAYLLSSSGNKSYLADIILPSSPYKADATQMTALGIANDGAIFATSAGSFYTLTLAPVPEPESALLALAGIALLARAMKAARDKANASAV